MSIDVVLVEDMAHHRGAISDLLLSLGDFRIVAELATEAEARLWFEEHPDQWELAVVDLILAEGTGMGVVAKARESSPDRSIVVFSSYATAGIREHCLRLGADAVFQKNDELAGFTAFCGALAQR